ncbi:HXXEE domain-containing protein [Altericista sp. CCNU0014]|uniref:HXXEE domain-containing protein n=1 Tax=Altericista sp. CCNU0014 TaxID=3082949 RepID=UPI00384D90D2
MKVQDFSIWLLAIALIVHTIAEVWLPEYERLKPNWRAVVFNRLLFLENLPVFIFSIGVAIAGWQLPVVGGILPAIGLTHPLLDHLGLSWKLQKLRPGSWTGLLLLFPLSILVYVLGYIHRLLTLQEFLISGAIGLAISVWLLWASVSETQV